MRKEADLHDGLTGRRDGVLLGTAGASACPSTDIVRASAWPTGSHKARRRTARLEQLGSLRHRHPDERALPSASASSAAGRAALELLEGLEGGGHAHAVGVEVAGIALAVGLLVCATRKRGLRGAG